jgi:flavin reductase (DIM6/NTAB) family NADH-FMN oxidoreductase RutF
MTHFKVNSVDQMERFYRANFINGLSGFKSPVLIGTVNDNGENNLAIFNNIVHLGSDPALIGFVNRPKQAAPHTLSNIEGMGLYTMNHVTADMIEKAHQTSAKYPQGVSEFDKTGLSPEFLGDCKAPFVKESPVKFSLVMQQVIPIHFNRTFFVIGAIQDIYLDRDIIDADGCLNLQQADIITSLGNHEYFTLQKNSKLPYAKP